jgi:peroxiredoxin
MDSLIKIGKPVPNFSLSDMQGELHCVSDFHGLVVVINFWSAECPWSARIDEKLMHLLSEWDEDVLLLNIASNASEPLEMQRRMAVERGLKYVLTDPNQQVASLYDVQIIPHLFLIDRQGLLRYQGAFDDMTFRQRIPQKNYLQDALEAVMNGDQPDPGMTSPYGCALVRYAPKS